MCGIAGVVAPHAQRLQPVVDAMLATLGHRGPDGTGTLTFADCVLGATRLAVVDPTGGDQPMRRADGGAGVAFNGEIYGHHRLRAASDYPFRTLCDTEVLLARHRAHGARFVEDLPGMFAYALWDERRYRLECGRDRFGEKPFFWAHGPDGAFVFASEIKALLATGWIDPVIDEVALVQYLRHSSVPPDRTIFRDVHVLGPAQRLTVAVGGPVRPRRYWSVPDRRRIGAAEAAEELAVRLDRAVADQLEADVPVGAFLSGGLDSSSVVALAAEHHDDLHTFSFGFGGANDETMYAQRQSEVSGTVHHAFGPEAADPAELLRRLPRVYDEPFGDASAVPTLLLSEAAREHVTVALTGDGADELLGGYLYWSRHFLADQGVDLPAPLGGPGPSPWPWRRGRLLDAYRGFRRYVSDADLAGLGLAGGVDGERTGWRPSGTVSDLLRFDLEGYLPGDILVKTDRASMAVGLELRSPFLDVEVAEFCLSLPDECKVDAERDKIVLRRAMAGRLAPGIGERDKLGFSGPMAEWLVDPSIVALAAEVMVAGGCRLHDLVDGAGVTPFVGGEGQATWNLLTLALWAEEHPDARR